uniref:RVP_2 domain-containing protein n=1 Tax=Cajanus cajan TaxID=3821 RepID=A0A151QXU6_CAJCA|nr:hypothetical protein KK1_043846 [Cajanus cajan]
MFSECGQPKAHENTFGPKPRPPTTGRVYTMTGTEAAQNNDLIQGTCFIKGKTLNVLYDSGATHSFISNYCVQHLQLSVSSLETNLIVSTPTNESIIAHKVCLDCPIFIGDRKFLVNLICLPLSQLDVILGMDWLSSNHAFLNCAEKEIFSNLHNVFHVSQLRKYIFDPCHVIIPDTVQLKDNLTYETMPVQITYWRIKQLRGKQISLVKVIWNEDTGDATWELGEKIRKNYPYLF